MKSLMYCNVQITGGKKSAEKRSKATHTVRTYYSLLRHKRHNQSAGKATRAFRLDNSLFPAPAPKHCRTDDRQCGKCDGNRDKYTARPPTQHKAQHISHRNFKQPKDKEIDNGRCPGVARAVERLPQHHSIGIKHKA